MNTHIRKTVLASLFAALIAVGAYIVIPVGPVPITLQTLFILTAGILGGRQIGVSAVTIYLTAGAVGLPVFSGGTGSIAHFIGPTGGYLIASLPAVFVCGLFSELGNRLESAFGGIGAATLQSSIAKSAMLTLGTLLSSIIFYLVGVPWLKIVLGLQWDAALRAGLIPFIIGDILKLITAVIIGTLFGRRVHQFLNPESANEPA